jgi:hypothetical protein
MVEFALCAAFLAPLMVGALSAGMNLSRTIQVTQLIRDAGHMYARFVDFSLPVNQDLLIRLGRGLNYKKTSDSKGIVILSKVTYISDADCAGASIALADCTNRNQYVVVNQIKVGNPALKASTVASPAVTDGKGDVPNYLKEITARATNFGSVVTLQSGQFAFVAEGYFQGAGFTLNSTGVGKDISARAIF